jgi:hypothetical protein
MSSISISLGNIGKLVGVAAPPAILLMPTAQRTSRQSTDWATPLAGKALFLQTILCLVFEPHVSGLQQGLFN